MKFFLINLHFVIVVAVDFISKKVIIINKKT